ncbi:GIY-YIG nuclease family protein [Candidatus Parcubacteria bacterium]|jgi:putative endonuclease|nr:MAG: GIY-YIG nuclease family protein [Candidatus Parcubacteria bacterium]
MRDHQGYVYIMTNAGNSALYVGATSELPNRVWQHKKKANPKSFTSRYNLTKLVYYEIADNILAAYEREHQIKAGSRKKKEALIEKMNPTWKDLSEEIE